MNELTYRDYINYLKVNLNHHQGENLLPDDLNYFILIKEQLDNAANLPKYILDAPLLTSAEYDEDTLSAISEIKKTLLNHSRATNYLNNLAQKIKQALIVATIYFRSPTFIGAAISVILLSAISLLLSLDLAPIDTGALVGTAGGGGIAESSSNSLEISAIPLSLIAFFFMVLIAIEIIIKRKK